MNYLIAALGLGSTLIQFGVAAYSLRLSRLFGTRWVGWSLFSAFALMALLHLVEAFVPECSVENAALVVEVVFLLIPILLLAGLLHIEQLMGERRRIEEKERELRAGLEAEIRKRTDYLVRSLEGLQAEMDERKRMEQQIEQLKINWPAAPGHSFTRTANFDVIELRSDPHRQGLS